ncbi:RNA polymerase sigma factor [bacterium]|nr:RNA polymerase sigma factor [bacterium]
MTSIAPEYIVAEYGSLVTGIVYRMISNPSRAEDALQDAWLEILKSLPSFEARSSISTWIYTIVYRSVIHHVKKERAYSLREMAVSFDKMQHHVACPVDLEKELWVRESCDRCMTGFLYCLDTDSKLAFLLRELGDVPYNEIADVLGKNVTSVRQMISRGKKKLSAFMENRCILFNPEGDCSCRMKEHVIDVDLPAVVDKMKRIVGKVRIFKTMNQVLPPKNAWEKLL